MLSKIRNSSYFKTLSLWMVFCFSIQMIFSSTTFALTGGPSQPEAQGFEPIGTSEMVDLFSGDFTYNIPLMDVGGYPINISYHSGVSMDQEASWVGLGWNINPGVINRNMRVLPDDFNGDEIKKEFNIKNNVTYGVAPGVGVELFGIDSLGLNFGLGLAFNNYKGLSFEMSVNPSIGAANKNSSELTAGLGLSASSESGVGISPSLSFDKISKDKNDKEVKIQSKVGSSFSSRAGLQSLSIDTSIKKTFVGKKLLSGKHKGETTDVTKNVNGGANISFTTPTYIPQIGMPLINSSLSYSATLGSELWGVHGNINLSGYFSGQFLSSKEQTLPAFGYLYTHNGAKLKKNLLDFNREKDGSFTKNTPNLPVTNFSYDVYSVSGQGIGGMYRPFRSDIGILYDSEVSNASGGLNFPGLEIGAGGILHGGANISVNGVYSKSGKWSNSNSLLNKLQFKAAVLGFPEYEPYYFKQAGEKTVDSDESFFSSIGDFDPVKVQFNKRPFNVPAISKYIVDHGFPNTSELPITANNTRSHRQKRNEVISTLTAAEASIFGLIKKIKSYTDFNYGSNGYIPADIIPRTTYPAHHISEITVVRADAARYIYGIPAYNHQQEEVSFAIEDSTPDCTTGLADYVHDDDNSKGNTKGMDNYYNRTSLPAYAHSYLITAVLSADYVDLTGDGPSDDDLGNYTEFHYTRATDNYQWRVPYTADKANYNEGFKSKSGAKGDDKGSYLYGKKDIWFLHSIETKTHLAEFELGNRADGFGVASERGSKAGKGAGPAMKVLKKIRLYSKPDKIHNANPKLIKTVHFEYDYSLVAAGSGVPNNNKLNPDANGFINQGGKLTLKKLYFTHEDSLKGKLNPYRFEYGEVRKKDGTLLTKMNPGYNLKAYNRWGNFKENLATSCMIEDPPTPVSTSEFPYVDQEKLPQSENYDQANPEPDRTQADINAAAWSLSTIQLPSGGKIKIDYEADDYAYVQNKRAMQMFKVVGVSETEPNDLSGVGDTLFSHSGSPHKYLIFKLLEPYDAGESTTRLAKEYFRTTDGQTPIPYLYFKFLVDLGKENSSYEYVPGYVPIGNTPGIDFGLLKPSVGKITHAWVKLDKDPNPIAEAAWNFTRIHLPRIAYDRSDPADQGVIAIFKEMVSAFKSIVVLVQGFTDSRLSANYGRKFIPERSFIRLNNPIYSKEGGGSRVARISMSDEWKTLSDNSDAITAEYGQEYSYRTNDVENSGRAISSGVASYEPSLGADENPFRQPVFFDEKRLLAPDDDFYLEQPFGESFFPGASVGYSEVRVKNLPHKDVIRHATGKVVHQFYTARDFPTLTRQTTLNPVRKHPNPIFKLLKIKNKDYMTASQGYVVELNDMHGKQKAQWVYQEGKQEPISGIEHFYRTSAPARLKNRALTIDKAGAIAEKTIGIDFDFAVDMRQQQTTSVSGGMSGNLDAFLAGIFPVVIPVPLPQFAKEQVRFRSAVTTKVINRYGLLDKVVAHDLGSKVSTENLLYDSETGEVLLTKTATQYDNPVTNSEEDKVYSMTYPAHWVYDLMGPAYKNIGLNISATTALADPNRYFVPGDEISLSGQKAWIVKQNGDLFAVDRAGKLLNFNASAKILRSGRRNQSTTPIGSVTTRTNPLFSSGKLMFKKVLNAGAVEFSEDWNAFCECGVSLGDTVNPYVQGLQGNWRAQRSYLHLTGRTQSRLNRNTNIREDGVFTSFTPFWLPPLGATGNWRMDNNNWTYTSEVTEFSANGNELENIDALKRASSAIYGYNQTLPMGVASNALYREIAFDSFEDYDFDDCADDHFSYESMLTGGNNPSIAISEETSHTGRRSLKIGVGKSVEIRKVLEECEEGC